MTKFEKIIKIEKQINEMHNRIFNEIWNGDGDSSDENLSIWNLMCTLNKAMLQAEVVSDFLKGGKNDV